MTVKVSSIRMFFEGKPHHVAAQLAIAVDQIGDILRPRGRRGFHQRQMQAHTQSRKALRQRHRVGGGRARHHQAGGAQDAVAVRLFDRVVDVFGKAEVVRGDNECAQSCTPRRSRRKAKNSTASRRRRFIISRLCAISITMEAILGARK